MTATPIVRASRADDIPAITAIYAHHVRHGKASWEETAPDEQEMARRRDAVLALGLPHLVAEWQGEVAGFAYAGPYRGRPAYRFTVENTIYVRENLRGQGIAGGLMQRLIDDCAAAGKRQMIAVIGDSANRPSIRLHEKMGFRTVGTFRAIGWKFGEWLDSVYMQRPLGPGGDGPPTEEGPAHP